MDLLKRQREVGLEAFLSHKLGHVRPQDALRGHSTHALTSSIITAQREQGGRRRRLQGWERSRRPQDFLGFFGLRLHCPVQ